jgi:menaquinol-cytochrome c reductase iron-sulfur subunit
MDDRRPGEGDPSATAETGSRLSRRRFVLRAMTLLGGGIAAALGAPVAGFVTAPAWRSSRPVKFLSTSVAPTLRSNDWTAVGKLADFEVGVPTYVLVDRPVVDGWAESTVPVGVQVVRQDETEVAVFDPHCTHLGCPLAWSSGAGSFVCPCHGGSFNAAGEVLSGPPPRSMVRYETRVDGDQVLIGSLPEGA